MKKVLPFIIAALGLLSPAILKAQDFSLSDTVWATTVSSPVNDLITNNATSSIILSWKVIASDFPADWMADTALGICDNDECYGNNAGALWNGSAGGTHTSLPYAPGPNGPFDYSPDLSGASIGTHYITVKLTDPSGSRMATFVISKVPAAVPTVTNVETNTILYPNPAQNELNVVYGASADIKNIAIYNIIGKMMAVYKVNGPSANLNLENIPSGFYFVRLVDSHGQVMVTRKFTKQ